MPKACSVFLRYIRKRVIILNVNTDFVLKRKYKETSDGLSNNLEVQMSLLVLDTVPTLPELEIIFLVVPKKMVSSVVILSEVLFFIRHSTSGLTHDMLKLST